MAYTKASALLPKTLLIRLTITMTETWLLTLLFFVSPYFILLLLADDEDDDQGPGTLIPAVLPNTN